jgi:cell division protein FtsN
MGTMTQAMTRLRDEIVSASHSRLAFRGDLVRQTEERRSQVSALCAGFARDRAGAHRAWYGRTPAEREAVAQEEERRLTKLARDNARTEQHQPAIAKPDPQKHVVAARPPKPAMQPAIATKPLARTATPAVPAPKHLFKTSKRS